MATAQTILHPTDFSEDSAYAFQMACSLARDYGARLVVLHVLEPVVMPFGELAVVPPEPEPSEEALREKLQQLEEATAKVRVETWLLKGDTVETILDAATDLKADLVVVGTHGRTGLVRLLMGSVAERVLRRAPCPVLVVKSPRARADAGREAEEKVAATP